MDNSDSLPVSKKTIPDHSLPKEKDAAIFLHFPLKDLGKTESIFQDHKTGIFTDRFKPVMQAILNKQLAVNTYYGNELIAPASTRISIEMLKEFDRLKVNFKVMKKEVSSIESHERFDCKMRQLIKTQKHFFEELKQKDLPWIQRQVHAFLSESLANGDSFLFTQLQKKYPRLHATLGEACQVLTSEKNYMAISAALNQIIESDRLFSTQNTIGETIAHILKMSWISLMMAQELTDFREEEYLKLGLICLGHDTGKALIPQSILYKSGRLTFLENEIMKSHVLFSFILGSKDQHSLDFNSFVMGLHHVKEETRLTQSYGIFNDTPTSFYRYLTRDAQAILDQTYASTRKFYRVINIADTFEAITARRVYKKPSSIGKALDIMIKDNARDKVLYPPYLNTLIELIIKTLLPEKHVFRITDKILDACFQADEMTPGQRTNLRQHHRGIIVRSCNRLDQELECLMFEMKNKKNRTLIRLSPMLFLDNFFF